MRGRAWLAISIAAMVACALASLSSGCGSSCTCDPRGFGVYEASVDARTFDAGIVERPACMSNGDGMLVGLNGIGPVTHQNRCTSQEITEMLSACFASYFGGAANDAGVGEDASELDAGDAGGGCDGFRVTHTDCATCIEETTGDANAPSPVVVAIDEDASALVVNVSGCVAALSGADEECKKALENSSLCAEIACLSCSGSDTSDCIDFALTDPSSYCVQSDPLPSAYCATEFNAVSDDAAVVSCGWPMYQLPSSFVAVATTFCGP